MEQRRFYLSPSASSNKAQSGVDEAQKWTLPVCFKTGSGQDCQVLTPETTSLKVPAGGLFYANAGGVGYYRTSYAADQYAALLAHVETRLEPAERISLIGDEWARVRSDKATVGDYLNLVAAVKDRSRMRRCCARHWAEWRHQPAPGQHCAGERCDREVD